MCLGCNVTSIMLPRHSFSPCWQVKTYFSSCLTSWNGTQLSMMYLGKKKIKFLTDIVMRTLGLPLTVNVFAQIDLQLQSATKLLGRLLTWALPKGTRLTIMMSFRRTAVGKSIITRNCLHPGHRLS